MGIENSLADLLNDDEALYRTLCYYKKHIYQLYDKRRQAIENNPDAWTVWHENHYKQQIKENLTLLDFFSRHLQVYTDCAAKDGQTVKNLLPYQEQDNQKLRTRIDQELEPIGAQIQDVESADALEILEKKLAICPTCDIQINRRPMKKNAGRKQCEIVRLVIPPPPCRVRFVYRDSPEEPIANGQILYWSYDNLPAREGKIENHTIRFTKFTSRMTPMGVCVTGPDGYALPGAPFYAKAFMQLGLDVKEGTIGISCKLDKNMIQTAAQGIDDLRKLFTAPAEIIIDCMAHARHIKNINIDRIVNSDFIQSLADPKKEWQSAGAVWPYEQIATTLAFFGATDQDIQQINHHALFDDLTRLEPGQKPPEVSQHYFQIERTYGFMAYPAYQGTFATRPVNKISEIETGGNSSNDGLAPDNPGCALWKGPFNTGDLKKLNGMYQATIALHCTLPEWDRRLNRRLAKLESAGHAYRLSVKGHVENLHRVRTIKEAADLYSTFPYDDLSQSQKEECKNLYQALEDLKKGIGNQMEKPEDHSQYCGIADAADNLKKQGQTLKDMLLSPAFCDELQRYMDHAFGQKDGTKDNRPAPGPYMQIEPHWNNIFVTIAKCYAALKDTEFGDKIYAEQVKGFLLNMAKEAAKLDLGAGELQKELKRVTDKHMIEPKDNDPEHNRLSQLLPRISGLKKFAKEIPEFETTGPLKIIGEGFLKTHEMFLRTPGPPCVAEVLLDVFYDYLFRDIAEMSKGDKPYHILIVFGFLKWTVRIKPGEVILFKRFYYCYIRAHGRAVEPGKLKKNLKNLFESAQEALKDFTKKKFPNRPDPGKSKFSSHVYEKMVGEIGTAAHGYKVFCHLLSLAYTIEALGNMMHEDAQNSEKSLIYTAKKVEMVGALAIGSMCALRTANKYMISSNPSWSFVKKGVKNAEIFWKAGEKWLDVGGTALAIVSSAVAAMEAYHAYVEKGDSKEAIKKSIEAIGEFALAAGHVLKKALIKKAAKAIGGRIAVRIVGYVGSASTVVGGVLTIGMILYDIASLLDALGKSQLDEVVQLFWGEVKESHFKNAQKEKVYYRKSYFATDLKPAFEQVDEYHKQSYLGDLTGVRWKKMNWRAIVPMYKMGFDTKTIEKSIKMDVDTPGLKELRDARAKEIRRIKHKVFLEIFEDSSDPDFELYKSSTRMADPTKMLYEFKRKKVLRGASKYEKKAYWDKVGEKEREMDASDDSKGIYNQPPMNVQAIIDYYNIVSAPEVDEDQFDSGKVYETVAKELSRGEFIPDQKNPENFVPQNQCRNVIRNTGEIHMNNPWCSKELISHTWDHDMFRKKPKS